MAKRKNLTSPFDNWNLDTFLPPHADDATFFRFGGQERAIFSIDVQSNPYRRELRYCSALPATECETITVVDSTTSIPFDQDMDGPSVQVVDGTPVMVFNISLNNIASTANVYQATPTADLSRWTAKPLLPLSLPIISEDDPTMSADGKIVAATRKAIDGNNDLWVAYRDSLTSPLSAAEPINDVNTPASEAAVEIFQLGAGELELYFTSKRAGDTYRRVYRSPCTY